MVKDVKRSSKFEKLLVLREKVGVLMGKRRWPTGNGAGRR